MTFTTVVYVVTSIVHNHVLFHRCLGKCMNSFIFGTHCFEMHTNTKQKELLRSCEKNANYIVYYVYVTVFTAVYMYVGNYVLKEYNYT